MDFNHDSLLKNINKSLHEFDEMGKLRGQALEDAYKLTKMEYYLLGIGAMSEEGLSQDESGRRGRGPYAKRDSMGRYSSDMSNDMGRDYSHDYSHDGYSRDESGHDSKQELARQLSEIQRKLNTM